MKRFALILAAVLLSACTATGGIKPQTPAQIAAQVCPPIQTTMTSLSALALDPKVTADLAIADGAVNLVCGAGAKLDLSSLQAMNASALPAIIGAIKAAPLTDTQKNVLILDVTAAQIILQGAIQAAANVAAS
jgi:hypothetical protein